MLVNADFSARVVIATEALPWLPSPQRGVERRLLDRIGDEVARATSLVRYAPRSEFPVHVHALGEEFLVLDGVFSDEAGDYAAGTYVRNPPGSQHAPRTADGCTILVKLRQMPLSEQRRVVVDTAQARWQRGDRDGHACQLLHADAVERVTLERFAAGVALDTDACAGGEEIFVLDGELADEHGVYARGTWLRNPPGTRRRLRTRRGATVWAKRGQLAAAAAAS
jgi:anti-sigma factor ChrR (cupin superfamily)